MTQDDADVDYTPVGAATAEVVPAPRVENAVVVENPDEIRKLTEPFEEGLKDLDEKRGYSLMSVWRQCMAFHSENALLRANLIQLEVLVQDQFIQWTKIRKNVGGVMEELKPEDDNFTEKMKALMELNESSVKTIGYLNKVIRDLKKEIRMTEFQSRFTMHLNIFQEFMTGFQGILWKHLQETELFEVISRDIHKLAKAIRLLEDE